MTLFMYLSCLTCKTVEDFLHFIRFFPFLSLWFLADSVSIRDHTVRVSFLQLSHSDSFIHSYHFLLRSIFRYKSILSLPLAELLLYGSEYHGIHPFTRYNYQINFITSLFSDHPRGGWRIPAFVEANSPFSFTSIG